VSIFLLALGRKGGLYMCANACCFTGHRTIPKDKFDSIAIKTEIKIRELISAFGVCDFYVGGALGYDTLAAQILFRLRGTEFPHIKVILIYPFEGFTDGWTNEQKMIYTQMFDAFDDHICASPAPGAASYLARDRQLAERSMFCICCCARKTGGTAYTVRYAKKKGLQIYNILDFDIGQL